MTEKADKPSDKQAVFLISDLETLKVMTDPLHLQMFELLSLEPQTVNQVAHKLGTPGSRLYYHFNLMESAGLIRVVDTRMVNNIVEKIYWVTADDIEIDRNLVNFSSPAGQDNVARVMRSSLDATREDILRTLQVRSAELERGAQPHPRQMVIQKLKKRCRDETFQQFVDEFNALLKAFDDLPEEQGTDDETSVYSIACFLYPSFAFGENNETLDGEGNHA